MNKIKNFSQTKKNKTVSQLLQDFLHQARQKKQETNLRWEFSGKETLDHQFDICFQEIKYLSQTFVLIYIVKIGEEKKIQKLLEMNEYKMNLLAKVAHDVRNPINSMNYLISETKQMLQDKETNYDSIEHNLTTMQSNSFFAMFLIKDILDYILFQQKNIKYCIELLNIKEFLETLTDIIMVQTKLKKIQFEIKNFINTLEIYTDSNRLTQVIINLISNAIKFTNSGGSITLQLDEDSDSTIKISVEDTGSGMQPEVIDKITFPFETFGNTNIQNKEGIGLGLYISPNDNFSIQSELTKGSVFNFKLYKNMNNYFQQTECQQDDNYGEASENVLIQFLEPVQKVYDFEKQISSLMNTNLLILIIDDDLFNLEVLKRQIQKFFQKSQILVGNNGEEAVQLFKENNQKDNKNSIKLIIMDCQMPVLDGYSASKIIKDLIKSKNYENAKIIGNSGLVRSEELQLAEDSGMDELIEKPYPENKLKETILKQLITY